MDKNIGILITDHNVQQTLAITNKTYIMFEGRILKEGLPRDLANDKQVREAYLGENFVYQDILNKPKKGQTLYNIWAGNFDDKAQLEAYVKEHFPTELNLRLYHGFNDISFASLADSELEFIFNNVIDKDANNAFVFQKEEWVTMDDFVKAKENSKSINAPDLKYLTTFRREDF